MTESITSICNLALDEVPAGAIVSIADNNQRAEVCRRQYPRALKELMELEWSFGIKRVTLSAITNDRSPLWGYAYAMPTDLGYPLRLTAPVAASNPSIGYGQTLAPSIGLTWDEPGLPFDYEGGTLWSWQDGAVLEYVTNAPEFSKMSASFETALAFTLAAKLVMPLTKDTARRDKVLGMAEVYRERALAADLNRNARQNRYGDNFLPETIAANIYGGEY